MSTSLCLFHAHGHTRSKISSSPMPASARILSSSQSLADRSPVTTISGRARSNARARAGTLPFVVTLPRVIGVCGASHSMATSAPGECSGSIFLTASTISRGRYVFVLSHSNSTSAMGEYLWLRDPGGRSTWVRSHPVLSAPTA